MIYEYALGPEVLNSWQNFRIFLVHFGIENGRLISRFPKHWKRMVYEACIDCKEIEKKKIEEKLKGIDNLLYKSGRDYDANNTWLNNAITSHNSRPFKTIISTNNPANLTFVVKSEDADFDQDPLKISKGIVIQRTAHEISKCSEGLIRLSKEVIFVDQHFGPENIRHRKVLEELLSKVDKSKISRIEYHLQQKSTKTFFDTECQSKLSRIIPEGLKLHLIRWANFPKSETLHPRYILTEIGGLRVEQGLDEGGLNDTTDIAILGINIYEKRWLEYQKSSSPFKFEDEIIIEGTK